MDNADSKEKRRKESKKLRWLQSGNRGDAEAAAGVVKMLGETRMARPWSSCRCSYPTTPTRLSSTSNLFGLISSLLLLVLFSIPSQAASIKFTNCLDQGVINSDPRQLQWVPLYATAFFNTSAPSHTLNVTVYGNVTGKATQEPLPPPGDLHWGNPNQTLGKLTDLNIDNHQYSTLKAKYNVLSYTPYVAPYESFCNNTFNTNCPVAPVFKDNVTDLTTLPAITMSHDMYASYAFTTITANLRVTAGDKAITSWACVTASVTPALGSTIENVLTYIPVMVLVFVGIATASAAIFSPWGTLDVFRWTTNYGRDADQLRLITPGFADCLQYIQFIILSGSLSLNYPGFFQPVVSRVSWSALMFNESFVTRGPGNQAVTDGLYVVRGNVANGTYGMSQMSQLVGMTDDRDIWAGMIIWLLVIIASLVALIQIGFVGRLLYRLISNTQEEDLRAKNLPFSIGNSIRVVFNYFLLPVVALSMYQLVIASQSPAFSIGLAAVTLVILVGFSGYLLWLIASTRPRSYLFDDLPTVLLYGPLYNTYGDHAATFALVPVVLTFLRGIAIGAVQASGIAQIVLLAICEVVLILMLNAFRPFSSPTSMNAFHTFFAVVRLLTILLMVAFIPPLSVDDAPRGWIGYVILLMHAITLFVGFFMHSLQTFTEVIARLAGAGGEEGVGGGAQRGGLVKVFGMRQLSRRNPRRAGRARHSLASDAAMLGPDNDQRSAQDGGRSRSMSASSAILLNKHSASDGRQSMGFDSVSVPGGTHSHTRSGSGNFTPTTPVDASSVYLSGRHGGTSSPRGGIVNIKSAEPTDPYFRAPRARRATMDLMTGGGRSRSSWASGDLKKASSTYSPELGYSPDPGEGPSYSGRATPQPAHLGTNRDRADSGPEDTRRDKTDYAIREVDYYYGVRGPALSHMPTRRLKTGPADPTGPYSAATGWFKNLFGGKTKEKGKGFEVIRSSRVPPLGGPGEIALTDQAPYKDEPLDEAQAIGGTRSRGFQLDDEGDAVGGGTRHLRDDRPSPLSSDGEDYEDHVSGDDEIGTARSSKISQLPPSLPDIDTGGDIGVLGRKTSKASSGHHQSGIRNKVPKVPRKSSKRSRSQEINDLTFDHSTRLSVISPSPPLSPQKPSATPDWPLKPDSRASQRLPFTLGPSPTHSLDRSSTGGGSTILDMNNPEDDGHRTSGAHARNSSALGQYSAAGIHDDRPSSLGYVQKHRASDHIHVVNPNDQHLSGSTAELVDDSTAGRPGLTSGARLS